MYKYSIISTCQECNECITLEHKKKFSDEEFNDLVNKLSEEVVEELLHENKEDGYKSYYNWVSPDEPMPWWDEVYLNVVDKLCDQHSFQKEVVDIRFEREYDTSWMDFCSNVEDLKDKYWENND